MSFNTENIQEAAQIVDFSFSSNRAKDWANLLTCHKNFDKPYLWSTEDHTLIKKNVHWETPASKSSMITKVFVTQCGNFGILGYADGTIVKINMQSGIQQKNFHQKLNQQQTPSYIKQKEVHTAPISGLFVDPYNSVLISSDNEYCLVNWDFISAGINKVIFTYPSKINIIKPSKTSNLFCVAYEDSKIELYDQYSFSKGRTFIGHKNRIMDICFTKNNRQVVSSSLDCTIKVWDIISGQTINNLQLKSPVVSLDFDPSGDFLVTAFSNSKEIFIWNNRIGKELMGNDEPILTEFVSEINNRGWGYSRKKYLGKGKKAADAVENLNEQDITELNQFFNEQSQAHKAAEKEGLVNFLNQDIGKWLPLINFDEIREKNKPKQKVESNISAPFFLEFDNRFSMLADKIEGKIEEEKKEEPKESTRVVRKENRNKFLEEVASKIEKLVSKLKTDTKTEKIYNKILEEMKNLSPAQLDYEVRMMTFGKIDNVKKILIIF